MFGKKKTESIIVCRSEGPMEEKMRKQLGDFLRQEFRAHWDLISEQQVFLRQPLERKLSRGRQGMR